MRTQKQENDGAKMLNHRNQLLLRHRLIILFTGLAIIISTIVLWIHYSGPPWYTILPAVILSGLGLTIALFQWIFPLTPHEPMHRLHELVEKKGTDNLEPQQSSSNSAINLSNEQKKVNTKGIYPEPDTIFQFNVPLAHPDEFYGRKNTRATLIGRTRKGASTSIVGGGGLVKPGS